MPGSPGLEVGATSHHRCPKTFGVWSAQLLQEDNTHIKLALRGTVKGSKQPPILLGVTWSKGSVFLSCQGILVLPEERKLLLTSIFYAQLSRNYVMKSEEGNGN